MNYSKEDFIRRWRHKIAGLALYGTVSELRDGPMAKASRVYDIPTECEALLAKMWDDLAPKPKPEPTNGVVKR